MGRYLFFNTEFEYKLVFGLQESNDILYFGGRCTLENGCHTIEWSACDIAQVDLYLKQLEESYLIDRPDLNTFQKTIDGTYMLKYYFTEQPGTPSYDEVRARYLLGLMIYHQLSYMCPLVAKCDF